MRRGSPNRRPRSSASSKSCSARAEARRAGAAQAPHRGDALCDAWRRQAAEAVPDRGDGAGAWAHGQWSDARGRGDRMHPCLFVDPRRSAVDGRRRLETRAPDDPPRLRRGDGDSRRRRRCRRWRSRSSPIPRPTQSRRCASRSVSASRAPLASREWWAGRCLILTPSSRRRRLSVEEIRRLQAMKTGALLKFSVEAGAILAGAGATARAALDSLRARDRRGVSDRRRHSRRRKRRGDARQARRQGRRAEQRHPGRIARARGRAPRARPPGRRGDCRESTRPEWAPRATCCARPRASSPCGRTENSGSEAITKGRSTQKRDVRRRLGRLSRPFGRRRRFELPRTAPPCAFAVQLRPRAGHYDRKSVSL